MFRRREKPAPAAPLSPAKPAAAKPPRRTVSPLWPMLALLAFWLALVHHMERTRVTHALDACQWQKWENWEGAKAANAPHRVAVMADPQLVDEHTYPHLPRLVNHLLRRMSDNYLYANYRAMQEQLDPHTTIFIGDLFDGGRDWDDEMWLAEYHRFNTIFPERPGRTSYRGLPGNHDIGFQNISLATVARFAKHFGTANDYYVLGNHTFIQMDTISLSHPDEAVSADARAFFEALPNKIDPHLPRIFLTHVPLYRDPKVELCGPGRELKKPFPLQRGVQYQTVIDYAFSEPILRILSPILVFSGDDHDYCDAVHVDYSDNSRLLAREISCKTPSMTNGIKKPAIHLLSLNNPLDAKDASKTYETTMCLLPSPYLGIKVYSFCLLASYALIYALIVKPEKTTRLLQSLFPALQFKLASFDLRRRTSIFIACCAAVTVSVLLILNLYFSMP